MSPPDLKSPEGRRAYRRELRRYARGYRIFGLALVLAGALLLFGPRFGWFAFFAMSDAYGWSLLAVGWIVLVAIIVLRTRYHLRRMRESGGGA